LQKSQLLMQTPIVIVAEFKLNFYFILKYWLDTSVHASAVPIASTSTITKDSQTDFISAFHS